MSDDDLQNGTKGKVTLADWFSVGWLSLLGLAILVGLVAVGWLFISGQIRFDIGFAGTISANRLYGTAEALFYLITILAIIELYGKKKLMWVFDRVNIQIGGRDEDSEE